MTLRWVLERKNGVVWTGLAQERDKWRALVNAVMNLDSIKCWETIEWLHNWRPV
jgi:hypothetical protein